MKSKYLLIPILLLLTINLASAEIPPDPANFLNASNSDYWYVNWTWNAGTGNITNSFNISQNGTWDNSTNNTWSNVTVASHGWSNISICAYNSSWAGNLSSCWSGTYQLPNKNPVQTAIGAQTITEDLLLTITITSTDPDSDTITYSTNATYGTLTSNIFTWTPPVGTSGTYIWYFTTTDNQTVADTDTEDVTITVSPYIGSGAGYYPPPSSGGGGGGAPPRPSTVNVIEPIITTNQSAEYITAHQEILPGIPTTPILIGIVIVALMLLAYYGISTKPQKRKRRR